MKAITIDIQDVYQDTMADGDIRVCARAYAVSLRFACADFHDAVSWSCPPAGCLAGHLQKPTATSEQIMSQVHNAAAAAR